jgi:hypothetical protein
MSNTHRLLFRVVAVGAVVAALAIPVVASASSGASIQVGSGRLLARGALVDVTVTFTCPVGSTVVDHGQGVYLQEAISRTQQASGSGGIGDGTACTGAPQTSVARVLANASGPPFRLGPAVAFGTVFACDPNFVCVNATSGYVVIKIHR